MILAAFVLTLALQEPANRPVLPGDSGYVLKRARELVELSRCRDAEKRTELLLSQSQERLREREAMEHAASTEEGARVARKLGESYRRLALDGGAATLECGVAEGRDMKAAQQRYLERLRGDHERWRDVLSRRPSAEEEHVLRVLEEAPRRAQAAELAGLEFLRKERARREALLKNPSEPERPTREEILRRQEHHPSHLHRPLR